MGTMIPAIMYDERKSRFRCGRRWDCPWDCRETAQNIDAMRGDRRNSRYKSEAAPRERLYSATLARRSA
jgi:hypothetical protein